jgi:hypothetical protein
MPDSVKKEPDVTAIMEALTAIKVDLHTNLRWLSKETPDVQAALRTSERLVEHVERLEQLLRSLR